MSTPEETSAPRPAGTLQVSVASTSELFRHHARVSIHDSKMMPVHLDTRAREFTLPAGLYQVSAVLQDGFEHRQLIQVAPDGDTEVHLGAVDAPADTTESASVTTRLVQMPQEVRKAAIGPWRVATESFRDMGAPMLPDVEEVASAFRGDDLPQAPREDTIALTSIQGAISKRLAPGRWRLHAVAPTDAVPTAAVDSGTRRYTTSMKSEERRGGEGGCSTGRPRG